MLNPILRTRIIFTERYGAVQVIINDGINWNCTAVFTPNEDLQMPFGSPLALWALSLDNTPRFTWIIHHALYDGWSMPAIIRQVQQAYRGQDVDQGVKFNAFIFHLRMQTPEKAHVYWQSYLNGFKEHLFPPLFSKSYQPLANDIINRKLAVTLSPQSVTTSTLIRAAWALLVARITNTNDTVFGVTLTGRNALTSAPGLEKVIGPTITTVPVRIQIDNKLRTGAFLHMIQKQAVEMIPFEYIGLQNILRICLETETACKFQTLLMIDPQSEDRDEKTILEDIFPAGGLAGNITDFNTYALILVFSPEAFKGKSSLAVQASFDSNVLDRAAVERLMRQLERVLQQFCTSSPSQTLEDIDCVSEQDLQQMWQWNAVVPESSEYCVHDLISTQTEYWPNAPAIHAWDGNMTYQELDEASWHLARHLKERGVASGVLVPIFFEKSKWASIAILGIIKAEGAFVAIDVRQPEERLRAIIQQTGSRLGVSSAAKLDLANRLMSRVVGLDQSLVQELEKIGQRKKEYDLVLSCARINPSALLYVVFTSGSTGTPKGVVITHFNFCSMVQHQAAKFGFKRTSRVYDFASYNFDVAINNMLMTFSTGGCLCVPHDNERINDLEGSIVRTSANLINVTSSVAKSIEPLATPCVKTLLLGGEQIDLAVVRSWIPKARVLNLYGPTECTVTSLANLKITGPSNAASIGSGLGVVTWIVDPNNHDHLAPMGAPGELLLEGPLLGLGYLNDKEKTASSFIYSPQWLQKGAAHKSGRCGRLYKTGDLVSYNLDGSINYLGRKDDQVKLRGQRIELGDVEYHYKQSSSIEIDVVVEIVDLKGSQTLVAFICFVDARKRIGRTGVTAGKEDTKDSLSRLTALAAELDDRIDKVLPRYMIPSSLIPIDNVPITISGKIDRRRLRHLASSLAPEQMVDMDGQQLGARKEPTTAMERRFQALWARLFDLTEGSIGVNDSFFRLGGNSITAMQLIRMARDEKIALTVAEIFKNPRLLDMARQATNAELFSSYDIAPFSLLTSNIHKVEVRAKAAERCNIDPTLIEDIYPCTPLQEGLVALTAKLPTAYISRNIIELPKQIDIQRFKRAWDSVVILNAILRTRIIQTKHGAMQVVVNEGIKWKSSSDLSSYVEQDTGSPMTMGSPLARWAVVYTPDDRVTYRFVWTIHHALYDGWTLPIITKQVHNAYNDVEANFISQQSVNFNKLIHYLQTQGAEESDMYWRSQLAGAKATTIFPTLPSKSYQPMAQEVISQNLLVNPRLQVEVTMPSIIRAAWAIVMVKITNSTDITFGATLTGRNAPVPGIECITGPTITTVPVRIRVDRCQKKDEFIASIQVQAVEMMPFEHVGMQNIRRICDSDSNAACDFQTLLMIQQRSSDEDDEGSHLLYDPGSTDKLADFNTYALMLVFTQSKEGIKLQASFDAKVIDIGRVKRLINQMECVIQQLCATECKGQTINDINCMSH